MRLDTRLVVPAAVTFAAAASGFLTVNPIAIASGQSTDIDIPKVATTTTTTSIDNLQLLNADLHQQQVVITNANKKNTKLLNLASTESEETNEPIISGRNSSNIYKDTINHDDSNQTSKFIKLNHVQELDQLAIPISNNNKHINDSLNTSILIARSSLQSTSSETDYDNNNNKFLLEDERLKRRLRRNISTLENSVDNIGNGFASVTGRTATPIVLHESLLDKDGQATSLRPKPLMMTKSPDGYYVLNNITLKVCINFE